MIIALAGPKLAGKGTIGEFLVQNHQAQVFHFSGVLSDILRRLHQPNTRAHLVSLGTQLRTIFGDDILARVLYDDLKSFTGGIAIIDGMRYRSEYALLSQLPDFQLWYVDAPVQQRFDRLQHRTEKIDEASMSQAEFIQREQDTTEQEISALQSLAQVTINNNTDKATLYQQIQAQFNPTAIK